MPRLRLTFASVAALLSLAAPARSDHPSAGFSHGIAGPIVTIPAEIMPKRMWAVTARAEFISFDAFSDQALEDGALAGEELHSVDQLLSPSLSFAYGLNERVCLALRLPYVQRDNIREGHLELGVPEVHTHGDSKGIGDLTLLGQWRLAISEGGPKLAVLAGVKLPTGQTDVASDDGTRFETEHQPGSGSTDPLAGLALSKPMRSVSLDADVLASFAMDGTEDTHLGTRVNYDAAVSFRLGRESASEHTHEHGSAEHTHFVMDGVLEANGDWRDRQTIAGVKDENSGGNLIYLSPGLRAGIEGRWSVSASVGIPVLQDWNGQQHDTSVRVLVGLGVAL